ncbi:hypothetical protein [Afifella pfennigii]|uniref:hypothetical protein n=1 Tax=Afifella pfennigii TaxID=209897 RepID=UPI00068E283E|nr:hypothetical protein [Afifella pfennigii]
MIFSLVELLLLAALVVTSLAVVTLHRRLKRLDAYHADYQRVLAETAEALGAAREAVARLNGDGQNIAMLLGQRIDAASALVERIDHRIGEASPMHATPRGGSLHA